MYRFLSDLTCYYCYNRINIENIARQSDVRRLYGTLRKSSCLVTLMGKVKKTLFVAGRV